MMPSTRLSHLPAVLCGVTLGQRRNVVLGLVPAHGRFHLSLVHIEARPAQVDAVPVLRTADVNSAVGNVVSGDEGCGRCRT
jgi:hypothetical protein